MRAPGDLVWSSHCDPLNITRIYKRYRYKRYKNSDDSTLFIPFLNKMTKCDNIIFKSVPIMGSYFGLGNPQQQVYMHARSKNTYNMHLFLPYLLNGSRTIHVTINLIKHILCMT